jgi:hypothetical protein
MSESLLENIDYDNNADYENVQSTSREEHRRNCTINTSTHHTNEGAVLGEEGTDIAEHLHYSHRHATSSQRSYLSQREANLLQMDSLPNPSSPSTSSSSKKGKKAHSVYYDALEEHLGEYDDVGTWVSRRAIYMYVFSD